MRVLPPPPLEIEKQKKKGHQSKFKAISPIFCYFFSRKYHLIYFLSWAPPPEKLKSKKKINKKKGFQILGPPYEFLDTRLIYHILLCHTIMQLFCM